MSWNTTKSDGDTLTSSEWNAMTTSILRISGVAGSGNKYTNAYQWFNASASKTSSKLKDIYDSGSHYTIDHSWYNASASKISTFVESGIKYTSTYNWFNVSAQKISFKLNDVYRSGTKYTEFLKSGTKYSDIYRSGAKYTHFLQSGTKYTDIYKSGLKYSHFYASAVKYTDNYKWYEASAQHMRHTTVSSQMISGHLLKLYQSRDISNWNSANYTNSGLLWNGSNWIAKRSGSARAERLYRKPTAATTDYGKIIVTSGAATQGGSWVWICLINSAGNAQWVQIAKST